jgi:hypothetical protein
MGSLGALVALALAGTTSLAETARPTSPISAELAKTCRELAIKAHPTQRQGSGTGSGQAQRDYFKECVAKRGNMQN